MVKDLSRDCLLGMELLETCPLTQQPIKQLKAVLSGRTLPTKPKQMKKIHRIQQQMDNQTEYKRKWMETSEAPTKEFFEGIEQQNKIEAHRQQQQHIENQMQQSFKQIEITRGCSMSDLPTSFKEHIKRLRMETEIDELTTQISGQLKWHQIHLIGVEERPPTSEEKQQSEDLTIEKLKEQVAEYIEEVCSNGLKGLAATSDITHVIELTDYKPFTEKFRSVPHHKRPEFKRLLMELYDNGIIVDSKSEYGSPPHVILKSDGSIRFTVDYTKLNSKTIKNNYPLPIIEDILKDLSNAMYFSKMDLESGYYCIAMDILSRKYTAFICEYGLFEWTRLPMGLKNSGSTFQKAMNELFKEHIGKFLYIYMDDFLIFSKTPTEHLEHLKIVTDVLKRAQMKIKLKKCVFFAKELEFLGHLISNGKIRPSKRKIEALFRYEQPTTLKQLLGFLGLANYYRKFIEHFAEIAHSLYELATANRSNK